MAYAENSFVWFEITTNDPGATRAFYTDVLGWTIADVDMGPAGTYPMIQRDGAGLGGIATAQEGAPCQWSSYLAVADCDATIAKVLAMGGAVHFGPQDVPGVGRIAVVADPQGATFCLFTSADPEATNPADGEGGFAWTELHSPDAEAVVPFYKAVFGYEIDTMPMPGSTYYLLKQDGVSRGGITTDTEVPPMWLPWVSVGDVDHTTARASTAGGRVVGEPMDIPGVGRIAVLLDPIGAALGVMTPAG